MRDLPPVPVSRQRLNELEATVQELKSKLADAFSVEEMDCIREQLTERAIVAEEAREQLEWNVRMELARVREAEAGALRAANDMRRIAASLANLLGDEDHDVTQPSLAMRPVAVRRRMHA